MEVHHKHHVPKKFKEYITEFLMLFTAVTLGFFAENYREHMLIEKKMHENFLALETDLRADSTNMAQLLNSYEKGNKALVSLNHLLFRFHTTPMSAKQLTTEFLALDTLPTYRTIFINNTTFKNIQSSGMLSYVSDKSLRSNASYYYEVMFKRLQDNNAIFDRIGMEFFDNNLSFINVGYVPKSLSKSSSETNKDLDFYDAKHYTAFMTNLPESQKLLQSEQLVYQSQTYYQRYNNYADLITDMQAWNNSLLLQLRSLHQK